jgi:exosortase
MTHQHSSGRQPAPFPVLALGAGLGAGLFWAYAPTLYGMLERWSRDPRYSHGYVVPVFALIVLWFRRDQFPGWRLQPSWWGVPLLLAGAALRLTGAFFYIDPLDGLSLLPALAGICLVTGGKPAFRWAWPALAFLIFMLPLPYQLEVGLARPLQRLATLGSTYALQTLGFAAVSEGNIILIDELQIGVLEACSGLGMLVTFFALSTAVAFIIQRPLRDKAIIFLSAVPIGVLMNLVRIIVTAILHQTAGSDIANLVFHDLAGWLMMPLALGVLWLELRFLGRLFVVLEPTGPVPVAMGRPATGLPAPFNARSKPSVENSLLETP